MIRKLTVLALLLAIVFSSTINHSTGATAFTIISSTWGTASSPIEVEPGDRNIPLTLAMQYTGSLAIGRLTVTLHPPSGFTDSNGASHPQAYAATIQPNTIFQLSFNLNIASNVQIGTHTFTVQFTWTLVDTTIDEEYVDTTIHLNGRVNLVFQTDGNPLTPGQENEITLTLRNSGSGSATKISVIISPPLQVSVLSAMPSAFSLGADQTRQIDVSVFVAATAAGSALTFSASSTYKDAYGNPRSVTQSIGFSAYTIGQASFTASTSTNTLISGETSRVRITIQNRGDIALRNLTVSLSTQPPLSITDSDGRHALGTVGIDASTSFYTNIFVTPSTTYTGSLMVGLAYVDSSGTLRSETRTLTFLISSKTLSSLTVSLDSTSLKTNSLNNVSVLIGNNGDSRVNNMTVTTVIQGSQVSIIGSNLVQILNIEPGENESINLVVFVGNLVTTSTAALTVTANYLDGTDLQRTETRTFGISIDVEQTSSPFSISIEPDTITTGAVNNLTVTLHNHGNRTVNTISGSFSFPSGQVTLLEPDIFQVAFIGGGESTQVAIQAFAPTTTASSTLLQILLKYYDSNGIPTQESRTIGILSRGMIDLELVDYSVIPKSPAKGQIFSVTATLTNTGTVAAYSLTATPNLTSAFRIFGSSSIFIGDVQANTQTTFTLSLQVDNRTTVGDYLIDVELSFSDNLRNDISVREQIPVTVIEPAQQTSTQDNQYPALAVLRQSGPYVLTGVAMLGAGFLVGKRFRKK